MADFPHFALPFQWAPAPGGGLAALETEQESVDEIVQCVEAIVRTVQGQRTSLPDFGRPALEFNSDRRAAQAAIRGAIETWEPRASSLVDSHLDPEDENVQIIRALISPLTEEQGE